VADAPHLTGHGQAQREDEDVRWDEFVLASPRGQFQQTSGWARLKALDGWSLHRVVAEADGVIAGGLQLLWKDSRFGRVGYVSKGPILVQEDPAAADRIYGRLNRDAAALGLRAVILQPPDDSVLGEELLLQHGFSRKPIPAVIWTTAIIDLREGLDAAMERMGRQTRREARQAVNRGVTVWKGGRSDLKTFFDLMSETCVRQRTRPNPSRLELLQALWDAFGSRISVAFASHEGDVVSGLLMIAHGPRLTFWKKGWNSRQSRCYANCRLHVEALEWASKAGYSYVDFAGMDPGIAETLLAGRDLSETQRASRDGFNLRLGVIPKRLPQARLRVSNPVWRRFVTLARRWPRFEDELMRRLG
jgi:lipid II:glycine glycyltransferase (peptidoglycan interpeptide bridge formation enzyme)